MEENSTSAKKRSKFGRFLSGIKQSQHGTDRKSPAQVRSEPLPVPLIPNAGGPTPNDQEGNAISCSTPTEPLADPAAAVVETHPTAADAKQEELPASIAIAQDRLDKAGENLKKKLPADLLASVHFEVKASADINSLADDLGSALVAMLEQANVKKTEQSHARTLVTEWAKKTIPFVETGLTVANVLSRTLQQESDQTELYTISV
jgi:hypothetical protein